MRSFVVALFTFAGVACVVMAFPPPDLDLGDAITLFLGLLILSAVVGMFHHAIDRDRS